LEETAKREKDLNIIIDSLKESLGKRKETVFVTSKDHFLDRIISCLNVDNIKAMNYLKILEARRVIETDLELVYFSKGNNTEQQKGLDSFG
jgi:phospholipid N-methyltransferase